jgi:hypothetical protein
MTTRKCRCSSDATQGSTKFQRIQWARKALRRMVLQMAQISTNNRLRCLKPSRVRKPSGTDRKFDLTKPLIFFPVSRESGGIRVGVLASSVFVFSVRLVSDLVMSASFCKLRHSPVRQFTKSLRIQVLRLMYRGMRTERAAGTALPKERIGVPALLENPLKIELLGPP